MGIEIRQTPTGGLGFWDDLSGGKGSALMSLAAIVSRTASGAVYIGTLPANAQIVSINVPVAVVSNAGTTATVSVGLSGGSATYFTAAQDVKTAAGNFSQAATAGWVPSTSKQDVTVTYTETGAASSAGNIYVAINYVVV